MSHKYNSLLKKAMGAMLIVPMVLNPVLGRVILMPHKHNSLPKKAVVAMLIVSIVLGTAIGVGLYLTPAPAYARGSGSVYIKAKNENDAITKTQEAIAAVKHDITVEVPDNIKADDFYSSVFKKYWLSTKGEYLLYNSLVSDDTGISLFHTAHRKKSTVFKLTPGYYITPGEWKKLDAFATKTAKQFRGSDLQKAKQMNSWLISNGRAYSPYLKLGHDSVSGVEYGTACASMFYLLCQKCSIKCHIISGKCYFDSHGEYIPKKYSQDYRSWNMFKANGKWYSVDIQLNRAFKRNTEVAPVDAQLKRILACVGTGDTAFFKEGKALPAHMIGHWYDRHGLTQNVIDTF